MPVGAPGGRRPKAPFGTRRKNPVKAAEYRHSEAGMAAKRLRDMNPETRAKRKLRRDAHRRMRGGF